MKWILLLMIPGICLSQPVFLNNDNDPIPIEAVNRSIWIINQRLHTSLFIAGESSLGCSDDSITIRRVTVEQWLDGGFNLFGSPQAFAQSCQPLNSGIAIVFGPNLVGDRPIEPRILSHEFLHALGMKDHLNDPNALMFGEPYSCCFSALTLTQADVLAISKYTHTTPDACFAEVLDNLDVMIPNIQGYQALLKYQGIVDGFMSWTAEVIINPLQPCEGFTVSNGWARLPDVRVYPDSRYRASLESVGELWVLREVQLVE